jgi:anti-sigma regulatory factor (Ser/Thr protein kinase)
VEVIAGPVHRAFPIGDASRIGEVRRHAAMLADEMGWGDVDSGRLALVVTELATNLLRHAQQGRLLVAARPAAGEVELISIDEGPGVANLDRCMVDGFSTGGSPGTGLGAVRRLAQDFDIHSSVPEGTVAVARVRRNAVPTPRSGDELRVAGICLPAPGETACGDAWSACLDGRRAAVMVADGLGHGPDAARASDAAMQSFQEEPFADLRQGLERAHTELRTTRGAAVCSLRLDAEADSVRGVGAGNVIARVVSGAHDRSMLTQHGTVGVQIRRVEEVATPWPLHALVVVHTDGIESRWSRKLLLPVLGRDPALVAAILMRDHCRGRDDATVVVLRRKD